MLQARKDETKYNNKIRIFVFFSYKQFIRGEIHAADVCYKLKFTVPCNMWHKGTLGHAGNVVHTLSHSTLN
jgi:hypothetical protein